MTDFEYMYAATNGGRNVPKCYQATGHDPAKHYAIKKGNGALLCIVHSDGGVSVDVPGQSASYNNAREAYEAQKELYAQHAGQMRGFSHLNVCFELEDFATPSKRH